MMNEIPDKSSLKVDYPAYLRGCEYLGWKPLPEDEFLDKSWKYHYARHTLQESSSSSSRKAKWDERVRAFVSSRDRRRLELVEHELGHLQAAVTAGNNPDDDGFQGSGVTAPLITGPSSRSGAEQRELPHADEESAA